MKGFLLLLLSFCVVDGLLNTKPIDRERLSRLKERLSSHSSTSVSTQRGVLIDLGANCGNSYLSFKELFAKQQRPEHFTYYLFEPNPYLFDKYLSGWSDDEDVIALKVAGWIQDGTTSFYLDTNEADKPCDPHSNKNPRGASSLLKDEYHPRSGERITVTTIDMNAWILEHVKPDDYCVLKVDIEGAEYELLRHLMMGGSMKLVDELYVEFHEPYTHKAALQWFAEAYSFRVIQGWH